MSLLKHAGFAVKVTCCCFVLAASLLTLWESEAVVSGQPVSILCREKLEIKSPFWVPYCANSPLDQPNQAERAVILINGVVREAAAEYELLMLFAARPTQADKTTIILAPQFLNDEDTSAARYKDVLTNALFWKSDGWVQGDNSVNTGDSSFAVVDLLLQRLANKSLFPKLKQIVIAGHSAGGQFVNRYAAGSQMEGALAEQFGLQLRYIVSNPFGYMYFNEERRVGDTLDQFAVPSPEVQQRCPEWNDYRHGLNKLNSYMQAVGPEKIRAQYAQREVIYLLGEKDNFIQAEIGCSGRPGDHLLQGVHRLERGIIYYNHTQRFYGPGIVAKHKKHIIPGVGHNPVEIWSSACGLRYLFDYNPAGCPGASASAGRSLVNTANHAFPLTGFMLLVLVAAAARHRLGRAQSERSTTSHKFHDLRRRDQE